MSDGVTPETSASAEPRALNVPGQANASSRRPVPTGHVGAWAAIALLCLAVGVAASVLGARALARSDAAKAKPAFAQTSAAIDSALALNIQHEEDLVVGASTFFASTAKPSPSQFQTWVHWSRALHRYPELQRLGFVALVRAPELPAFEARLDGRPAQRSRSAGARPYSCLASVELTRGAPGSVHSSTDRCASTPGLLASATRLRPSTRPRARPIPALKCSHPYTGATPRPRASSDAGRRSPAGCARCSRRAQSWGQC